MTDATRRPVIMVFAGPNGSGKSTVTRYLQTYGTYVNADDIKKELGLTDIEAAQRAERLRNELIDGRTDFTFETVLSTERNLLLLQKAKERGYEIQGIYVLTRDVRINVERVRDRVAAGGHDVPEDKIRARYIRSLELLPLLVGVCDEIAVYDNSETPTLIFYKSGGYTEKFPNKYWMEEAISNLIGL